MVSRTLTIAPAQTSSGRVWFHCHRECRRGVGDRRVEVCMWALRQDFVYLDRCLYPSQLTFDSRDTKSTRTKLDWIDLKFIPKIHLAEATSLRPVIRSLLGTEAGTIRLRRSNKCVVMPPLWFGSRAVKPVEGLGSDQSYSCK